MFEKTVICTALLTDQIFLKFYSYYFLLILGVAFIVPSQCLFLKLQLHVIKILWNNFGCIVFQCSSISSKRMSHIFKIIFRSGDINFFVHRGVFLSYIFKSRVVFLAKKNTQWNQRHTSAARSCLKFDVVKY